MNWPLRDTNDTLAPIVDEARRSGPQIITEDGQATAVVISIEDYQRLAGRTESLLEFFQNSPLRGVDLDLSRDDDTGRDVVL